MRAAVIPELRRRLPETSAPTEPEGSNDLSNAELLRHLDSQAREESGG